MAVRCMGEVTLEKLEPLRDADAILREEVESRGLQEGLWQYFAVYVPQKTVGVKGDARVYQDVCVIRIVSSQDAMTADWEALPMDVMRRVSNRILNEVDGFARAQVMRQARSIASAFGAQASPRRAASVAPRIGWV